MSPRWTNADAGPRQVKDLQRAVSALSWEGRTSVHITGTIGGPEYRSTLTEPFGTIRPDVAEALDEIGSRWGWRVTRANIREVIAAYTEATVTARSTRPKVDERITRSETEARNDARIAREAAQQARVTAGRAIRDELLGQMPTGASARQGDAPLSDWFHTPSGWVAWQDYEKARH